MSAFHFTHEISFSETNLVGNVYFTNHIRWQSLCRDRFLAERAPGVLRAMQDDIALITVHCHCEYLQEFFASDTVELRMRVTDIGQNQFSAHFDYWRLTEEGRQLAAKGMQRLAVMRRQDEGWQPVPMPPELAAALKSARGDPGDDQNRDIS